MKEVLDFEKWADDIISEAAQDRPLPRGQDIQYQASAKYPDRSPEQALQLFVADKLQSSEQMDFEQNKLINAQKRENEKLRRSLSDLSTELQDHEKTAQDTEREVQRLRDLSAKLKPAGEIQKQVAKADADRVQGMLNDVAQLKNKPGIDKEKFTELVKQVNNIKDKASNQDIDKVQDVISKLSQQREVHDTLFNKAMDSLQNTQQELDRKEQRFQKYIEKKGSEIEQMSKSNAGEIKKYADMVDQYKEKIDGFGNDLQSIDQTIQRRLDTADELYTKAWSSANRIRKEIQDVQDTAEKQDMLLNRILQLVGGLGPEVQQQVQPTIDKLSYAGGKAQSRVAADDDEVQAAKIPAEVVSGEELTGDENGQSYSKAADELRRMGMMKEDVMNEEVATQQERFDPTQKAIDVVYPLYIRKYPGDAHSYPEEFLKKAMRDSIWTGLIIYTEEPDFDEQYIFRYMEKLQRKIHKLYPRGYQPELKGISGNAPKPIKKPNLSTKPQPVTAPPNEPGLANYPPGRGPGMFKESLITQYEKELNKLTGGF